MEAPGRVTIAMSRDEVRRVDLVARSLGLSRSKFLRRAAAVAVAKENPQAIASRVAREASAVFKAPR